MPNTNITDGYDTITRGTVTSSQLFDLAHDLLGRLDALEWAFACLTLVTLRHVEAIGEPPEPATYKETLEELRQWMAHYQRDQARIEADRQFMHAPE